jgi:peptidyl-prolyl cis-trans isomerase B (cyclophilin B)
MTAKKKSKAYEQKRREQLQIKINAARARKRRNTRIAAFTVGALALIALTVIIVMALVNDDSPASSDAVTSSPVPSVAPSANASSDEATPDAAASSAPTVTAGTDETELDTEGWTNSLTAPGPELAEDRMWTVHLDTDHGPVTFELDGVDAPQAVASFISLAQEQFFDGTDCHRLTTAGIFVLQCGDPSGSGSGGPGYRFGPLENTPADDVYTAGSLAMARVGNDAESMGSQFFIVYEDSVIPSDTAGGYTVFGQVTEGLAIVRDIAQAGTITGTTDGRPAESVIINEVTVS